MMRFLVRIDFTLAISFIVSMSYGMAQENEFTEVTLSPAQNHESLADKCTFIPDRNKVICNNVTDLSGFNAFFKSRVPSYDYHDSHTTTVMYGWYFNFFAATSYDIILNDVRHIPAKAFQKIKIDELILDGPDITVDRNVFEGINELKRFIVRRSNIQELPDFSFVESSISEVNIRSSPLTSLKGRFVLKYSRASFFYFTHNSMTSIDGDIFQGSGHVIGVNLSHNLLPFLPPNLLNAFITLNDFDVSYNNLLHVDNVFKSHNPPYHIYLNFNNITSIESVLQFRLSVVTHLELTGNPIKRIPEGIIGKKIPNLQHLRLNRCQLRHFHLDRRRELKLVDLNDNLIEAFNQDLGHLQNTTYKVQEFYLNGNKLQNLGSLPTNSRFFLPVISESFMPANSEFYLLDLARNEIQHLKHSDFRPVKVIRQLVLRENKVQRIESDTFQSYRYDLQRLDLSVNLIRSLNGSVRYLSRLGTLILNDNSIQSFTRGEFTGAIELSELYLQNNQVKFLGQLQKLYQLNRLVITNNSITVIKSKQVPPNLKFLELAGNPIKCDCGIHPFILWLNASGSPSTDVVPCSKFERVESAQNKSTCPEMCTCGCVKDGDVSFMSVDCSARNLSTFTQSLKNSFMRMDNNAVDQNVHPSLHIEDRVAEINFQNNRLETLQDVHFPKNVVKFYLANNELRQLPRYICDHLLNLKDVSLSGNPWDCDCSHNGLQFKKWLTSNYAIIRDINSTRCGTSKTTASNLTNRVIWALSDLDICPTNVRLIYSATVGVLAFLTLCLIAKILYTKYQLNIKVFLWSRGFTFVKEDDIDQDKVYDAFLSFSDTDGEFVIKQLISEIEKKSPDIRLCIHYRDFRAGEFIQDNIKYAVLNSKRTVLILSKNFLESEWCLMEFKIAHVQALRDRVHRIVMVIVGELPKEMDPQIKAYLDSTTYLTWGEKHFWNKLLFILPTSGNARDPIPRNRGITTVVGTESRL